MNDHANQDRAIWVALQGGDIMQAAVMTKRLLPEALGNDLLIWAHVIGCAPLNRAVSLRELAQRIPNTNLRKFRALDTVCGLAAAIDASDWPVSVRHAATIRHYCPEVSRNSLASVISRLIRSPDIDPRSPDAETLFRNLSDLMMRVNSNE